VERVSKLKTSDGALHESERDALKHIERLQYAIAKKISENFAHNSVFRITELLNTDDLKNLMRDFLALEKDKKIESQEDDRL
jgi:hypothetical protein